MGFCRIHIDVQMRRDSGCLFSFKPLNKNFKAPLKSALAELIIITGVIRQKLNGFSSASSTVSGLPQQQEPELPFIIAIFLLRVFTCWLLY